VKHGIEEGEICGRNGCQGVIKQHLVEGCWCHISPPYSACTKPRDFCPVHEELARTKCELQKERDKVVCPDCRGHGRLVYASGGRSVDTQCDKCSGEGYYIPR